jgi:hypothetical protein
MSELEVIRQIAREVLTAPTADKTPDSFLLDRAERLVRNAKLLSRLPELAQADLQIDRLCLAAAAYLCQAGLAAAAKPTAATPPTDSDRRCSLDAATRIVAEKLTGILPAARVDKINRIIVESENRFTKMTEAVILADARSLDDMGAVGIFAEVRRHINAGKAVAELLASWQQKLDYRYWQARLKDGLHLPSVRLLAEARLAAAQQFIAQLSAENAAADLEHILSAQPDMPGPG